MPIFGFRLVFERPEIPGRGVKRMEIDAPDQGAARIMLDGWAAVEGVTITDTQLLADGMTFREAGKRRALEIAGHLATRYGATVGEVSDDPGGPVVVRVTLPNGRGLSLATDGAMHYDPAPAIEALAFDGEQWVGDVARNVDAEWCASMMDDLIRK